MGTASAISHFGVGIKFHASKQSDKGAAPGILQDKWNEVLTIDMSQFVFLIGVPRQNNNFSKPVSNNSKLTHTMSLLLSMLSNKAFSYLLMKISQPAEKPSGQKWATNLLRVTFTKHK